MILVTPLTLEHARSLEDARARHVAQASEEFLRLANHSADTQREVISSVETVLKSAGLYPRFRRRRQPQLRHAAREPAK